MKCLTLILVVLLLSISSFGQKIRFSDSTNVWHYNYFSSGILPAFYWSFSDIYTGDTAIGGRAYKQLWHNTSYETVFIREDTIMKKVYVIMPFFDTDTTEKLLYDYTLNVGDTFRNQFVSVYVGSIDSVLVGIRWHRVWHFLHGSFSTSFTVIEGVGCISDPCAPIEPPPFEGGHLLTCFSTRGSTPLISPAFGPNYLDINSHYAYYFDNSTSCSYNFAELKISSFTKSGVTIYPNPAQNEVNITSSSPITTLSITNLIGQQVYSRKYNSEQLQIDIADLPSGVYFIRINGTEVRKFVKQ